MRILRTIAELREAVAAARADDSTVGLVPTMGALHEGHLSLVRAARSGNDLVVMSIFVNPMQFTESADLSAYPRQEEADTGLAESAGVDIVFAPAVEEMYPAGFATTVHVGGRVAETLEGRERGSAHFDGVATVVSKLLIACMPDAAYFGQKDAQQLVVVRRMVRDLGIPTRVIACPILRDADGLALSSRNVRLTPADRARALAIPRALQRVEAAVAAGDRSAPLLRAAAEEVFSGAEIDVEYLALVDPDTLEEVDEIAGPTLCAVAARLGEVRLIDNTLLLPRGGGPQRPDRSTKE